MKKPETDPKNAALNAVLLKVRLITQALDLRWLREELHASRFEDYRAKLHGYKDGHEGYPGRFRNPLKSAFDAIAALGPADLETLEITVSMLHDLMSPHIDKAAKRAVQIKTLMKAYIQLDLKTGLPELDANGEPMTVTRAYDYAYVRVYAGRGNADRRKHTVKSFYADRGMGVGGSGGYVAAALRESLITEEDVLNAWQADGRQGKGSYQEFIDQCADLLHGSDGLHQDN